MKKIIFEFEKPKNSSRYRVGCGSLKSRLRGRVKDRARRQRNELPVKKKNYEIEILDSTIDLLQGLVIKNGSTVRYVSIVRSIFVQKARYDCKVRIFCLSNNTIRWYVVTNMRFNILAYQVNVPYIVLTH